ncbi:MAG: Wzt carbohydrate-binding domain-containing protein, partial [Dehalococcoidia bacterium]|nr:Wzt carbohydrate-binding domain-containing protein [Dehalococcoidia bacterium]
EIKEAGKTIILVSHNLQMVKDICAQAVWLDGGLERASGPSVDVVDQYLEWANLKNKVRLEGAQGKTTETPEEDIHRWGTREVEITSVEFLDGEGRPATVFGTGDPLTVRMHYWARQRVDKPVFGIAIHRIDNLHINGPNTKTSDYPIDCVEGEGVVEFRVLSLPFLEGTYRFSAAVYDYSCIHPYDHHDRMYTFTVQPKTMKERNGFLHIPCQWRLDSEIGVHEGRASASHR